MRKFLNKIEFITITAILFIFLFLFFTSENSFLLLDSNISESTMKKKETPVIITPEKKETPVIIAPEKKETPMIIAMTIAKIISDKNLLNSDFILNGYEEKNWETSSMGCPKNGLFYQSKQTSGYILESLINTEKTFYHINNEGEYINCTEVNLYNNQSNLNFVEKFKLNQSKAIVLSIREGNKTLAVIDEKEEVTNIINSLNITTTYHLTFNIQTQSIIFRKYIPLL